MSRVRVAIVNGGTAGGAAASLRAALRIGGVISSAKTSIAHRGSAGAAATVPEGWRVGVDLERVNSVRATELRYFLTNDEQLASVELDPTALWCLKEAAWKALGCLHTRPFKSVELLFARDERGLHVSAVRVDDLEPIVAQCAVRIIDRWVVACVALHAADVMALSQRTTVAQWPVRNEAAHAH